MRAAYEQAIDMAVQAVGLVASLISSGWLIGWVLLHRDGASCAAATVYGMALTAMFACSLLYSAAPPNHKAWLRLLDHVAIYLLIAGTYTPVCLLVIGGSSGTALLVVAWSVAALGIVLEIVLRERFQQATIVLYLLLGWAVVIEVDQVVARLPSTATVLLVLGGVFYTLGVPAHCCRRLPYHKAIWHGAVLIAAGCHYGMVTLAIGASP